MTRRIWLVRHGETEGQSSIRFHGSNDVPLSDAGRAQIRALVPLLAHVPFCRIVHSPQVRAVETAAILAAECALDRELLLPEDRLREISFGDCEGLTAAEIEARFPDFWSEHRAGRAERFPGGEPRRDYAARVSAVAEELIAGRWRGDLLIVGHRGTVRQFLRGLLGFAEGQPDEFAVDLASLTVLREEFAGAPVAARRFELELLGALP